MNKETRKKYREKNKEKINEQQRKHNKKYREKNKEKINEQQRKHYQKNKEKIKEHYQENKEKLREKQRKYRQENKEKVRECNRKHYQENKEKRNEYQRKHRQETRLNILDHYCNGNIKCQNCGIEDVRVLALDHIYNNGNIHRKKTGSGTKVYLWIIKNNFPPIFQVLCYNCNWLKYHKTLTGVSA